MLPKYQRLARQQFWPVLQTGKSIALAECVVKFLPNSLGYSRWAIVTSAKLDKSAVIRNRLRRDIYNSVETLSGNCDIIIFPKSPMLKLSHEEIRACLNPLVSKISH